MTAITAPLDIAGAWRQAFNGVYNAQGRKIGSYETMDALCAGRWFLLKGETSPGNAALYIKEFSGRLTPVPTMCFQTERAAPFATPAQKAAQTQLVAKSGGVEPIFGDVDFSGLTLPALTNVGDLFGNAVEGVTKPASQRLLIFGGLAVVAGVILFSGGRR